MPPSNYGPAYRDVPDQVLQHINALLFQEIQGNSFSSANPFSAAVTAVSGLIVSANPARHGSLIITNTGTNTVFLSFGQAAVAGCGLTLFVNDSVVIPASDFKGAVYAICSSTLTSTVAISEGHA